MLRPGQAEINMKKRIIHYICLYTDESLQGKLFREPAECAKIEYMVEALKSAGYRICLFSTRCVKSHWRPAKPGTVIIDGDEKHQYVLSMAGNALINKINAVINRLQIILYVLLKVKKSQTVLLYHQYYYYGVFTFLKRIKKFELVLEIEELHFTLMHKMKERELRFITLADKYLLIQPDLLRRIDIGGKPYLIAYGDYRMPGTSAAAFYNNYDNIVFAGVIESRRNAAFVACRAAEYLDSRFRLHILGFGPEPEIQKLRRLTAEVNHRCGEERVIYHGKKTGVELSEFLNACRVGLSCHSYSEQDRESEQFSFPSKIMIYMAHNLWVVSPDIACVRNTPFNKCIRFYSNDNKETIPLKIASCIKDLFVHPDYGSESIQPREQLLKIRAEFEAELGDFFSARP